MASIDIFPSEGYGAHVRSVLALRDYTLNTTLDSVIVVKSPEDLEGSLDSSKVYVIDGIIDFTGTGISIVVPSGGLNLQGSSFDVSQLVCTDPNYTLFNSNPTSGNLVASNLTFTTSGSNSRIYNLAGTGSEAIELNSINYVNCTSLGTIDSYRQLLEEGTGRFSGTPELTFEGSWGGARITTSIALGMSDFTSLFKAGPSLLFSGRFITDMNCNLPPIGAFLDFSDSNIDGEESLIISGAFIRRNNIIDASDSTITPNISEESIKSLWSNNTGVPNTHKYIKSVYSTEVTTIVSAINTYYPLEGTLTIEDQSHFTMPVNGQYELSSGNGVYHITGDLTLESNANNQIDIQVTRSIDGGVTWSRVQHVARTVNNLSGARDVAFFPISFTQVLNKGDRIRLEVENKSGANNITAELDSYISVIAL